LGFCKINSMQIHRLCVEEWLLLNRKHYPQSVHSSMDMETQRISILHISVKSPDKAAVLSGLLTRFEFWMCWLIPAHISLGAYHVAPTWWTQQRREWIFATVTKHVRVCTLQYVVLELCLFPLGWKWIGKLGDFKAGRFSFTANQFNCKPADCSVAD
jgi:hypothetical protein